MKVAILGSGNGACAAAADWSLAGHEVSLFDFEAFPKQIEQLDRDKGIRVEGELEGFAPIVYAGHDIAEAIRGAALILAIGPSFSTEPFAEAVKACIEPDQVYIVCPGSFGGALITKKIFGDHPKASQVLIGETSTLPYASRLLAEGGVKIFLKLRGGLYLSTIPSGDLDKALDLFRAVYPHTEGAKNVFQTMLQNSNPVLHPSITLMNAALIERTSGDFLFYEEGITPGVANLLEAVDRERLMIAEKLGVQILPDNELGVLQGYMEEATYHEGYTKAPGFQGIKAQSALDHRYLNEDVGYGLVFMSHMADQLGVDTPLIDSVIRVASAVRRKDYRGEAVRTLDTIGITVDEILEEKYEVLYQKEVN